MRGPPALLYLLCLHGSRAGPAAITISRCRNPNPNLCGNYVCSVPTAFSHMYHASGLFAGPPPPPPPQQLQCLTESRARCCGTRSRNSARVQVRGDQAPAAGKGLGARIAPAAGRAPGHLQPAPPQALPRSAPPCAGMPAPLMARVKACARRNKAETKTLTAFSSCNPALCCGAERCRFGRQCETRALSGQTRRLSELKYMTRLAVTLRPKGQLVLAGGGRD